MGTRAESDRGRHIVSVRLTAEEMKVIRTLSRGLDVNVSTLLRQSLNILADELANRSRSEWQGAVRKGPFSYEPGAHVRPLSKAS